MKAIRKTQTGKGVELTDLPIPVPTDDEVLVKVEAVSICGSDVHMYEGLTGYEWITMPLTLGHEFSGRVIQAGGERGSSLLGKRVVINPYVPCKECDACLRGQTNLCDHQTSSMAKVPAQSLRYGFRKNGGMAEYAVVKATNVLELPDACPVEIAGMLESIGIGVQALEKSIIKMGDSAVVIGPGPIGLTVVSILSKWGLNALIVVGLKADEKRLTLAKELGATHIVYADTEDAIQKVAQATKGKGVEAVFETSGHPTSLKEAVRMVRKGGEVLLVGISSQDSTLPTSEIVRGEVIVKGVYGVTKKTLERTIHMASSNLFPFHRLISHNLPLEEAVQGFELAINKESVKIILQP